MHQISFKKGREKIITRIGDDLAARACIFSPCYAHKFMISEFQRRRHMMRSAASDDVIGVVICT